MKRCIAAHLASASQATPPARSIGAIVAMLTFVGVVASGCASSRMSQEAAATAAPPACATRPQVLQQEERWRQYANNGDWASIVSERRASYQPPSIADCPADHKETYALLSSAYESSRNRAEARRYRRLSDLWALYEARANLAQVQSRAARDGITLTSAARQ